MDHTVTYRYGRADYIALLRALRSQGLIGRRFGRWGRYVCFGLFFVALILLIGILSRSFDPEVELLMAGIGFVIIVLTAPVGEFLADRGLALCIFPRFSAANKNIQLTFTDDGIRAQHDGMEGKLPWGSVKRILETDDYVFLPISRAEMVVVPRRALPSAAAAAELTNYIRSKVGVSSTALTRPTSEPS
jgi:hypothetical protein